MIGRSDATPASNRGIAPKAPHPRGKVSLTMDHTDPGSRIRVTQLHEALGSPASAPSRLSPDQLPAALMTLQRPCRSL